MSPRSSARSSGLVFAILVVGSFVSGEVSAQLSVEGLDDREVYRDRVSFRVPVEPGFDYEVELSGEPVPAGVSIEVTRAGYYELFVSRREATTGDEESLAVRFIVRASERGNSEWGLFPWVPRADIPSSSAELAGARLVITTPAAYPAGLEVPVIARLEDATGRRVGANGAIELSGFPDRAVRLLRGVGSGWLPAAGAGGLVSGVARLGPLETSFETSIDPATSWSEVSGHLESSADWGEDARVRVTSDLTVPAGGTLSVGAGSIVRLAPGVSIEVEGTLRVEGDPDRPVVFAPETRDAPWGGFLLRTPDSLADLRFAVLTGSGADPDWFDNTPGSGSSHRDEEALLYLSNGATANLADCWLMDGAGQAGHGEDGFLDMNRCLIQRFTTAGQYNGGSVRLEDCALVEFPSASAPFEDDDNDGLYLTGGAHVLTDCLVGWALDDGIDAGSGSGGSVDVSGCWIESCYHEGMAWSRDRVATVTDTVVLNCGQGIECGFGAPQVEVRRSLSTGNLVGARFGDNYDWDYEGFLRVMDSLLLFNQRDVWGRAWDNWEVHLSQMDIRANLLSALDPTYPENVVWDPATDAGRLAPFLPAASGTVGAALAVRSPRLDRAHLAEGLPVRLSSFTTQAVSVSYTITTEVETVASGEIVFLPGETVKEISLDPAEIGDPDVLRVRLHDPVGAELTGLAEAYLTPTLALIARGSVWRYLDGGVDPGASWLEPGFDDGAWPEGPGILGFGDGDEATEIDGGPSGGRHPTVYFRKRFEVADPASLIDLEVGFLRDDGGLIHLNGVEVVRSNMRAGEITHDVFAEGAADEERAYSRFAIPAGLLVPGTNVVAVEVHQANATSSDLAFDLELTASRALPVPGAFVRGDANGDRRIDISDPIQVLLVLFKGSANRCLDAVDADDSGAPALTDAVYLLDYLFRGGARPPAPFPSMGLDPTEDDLECE